MTGQLLVSLEFQTDAEPAQIAMAKPYPVFPTVPSTVGATQRARRILFLVYRRERASDEAKLGLINVLVEYHQAVADFHAATGKL